VKRIIIDTNALISFVTARNPEQQSLVAPLFAAAAQASVNIVCPANALAEFAYVMNRVYAVPNKDVAVMIKDFIALPGVTVAAAFSYDFLFQIWPGQIPEYGDAIIAATAKAVKGSSVATFDKKLRTALENLNIPLHIWK
jgi:predicted nucleic acid-binding protein